jgi:proteasome lid subunit RPN8/RPN11
LPDEAVGLLAGAEGRITAVIPLPNIAPTGQFLADPYAQYQAERQLQEEGMHLLAIYHSHPAGGTQLSPLDIKFAKERPCLQVVIALDPARPGHETPAGYDLETKKPCTVAIR